MCLLSALKLNILADSCGSLATCVVKFLLEKYNVTIKWLLDEWEWPWQILLVHFIQKSLWIMNTSLFFLSPGVWISNYMVQLNPGLPAQLIHTLIRIVIRKRVEGTMWNLDRGFLSMIFIYMHGTFVARTWYLFLTFLLNYSKI